MARLNYDFKRSYVFGGLSVVLTMGGVVFLAEMELHPAIWISAIFLLFLLLQYVGLYRPNITCGECGSDLYSAVEAEYKRITSQKFKDCPNCGVKFDKPKQTS